MHENHAPDIRMKHCDPDNKHSELVAVEIDVTIFGPSDDNTTKPKFDGIVPKTGSYTDLAMTP